MTRSAKFGIGTLLLSILLGFAGSFLFSTVLWIVHPQFLAGGRANTAGGLDVAIANMVIIFLSCGVVFSVIAGFVLASRIKREAIEDRSPDGWWPPPPL